MIAGAPSTWSYACVLSTAPLAREDLTAVLLDRTGTATRALASVPSKTEAVRQVLFSTVMVLTESEQCCMMLIASNVVALPALQRPRRMHAQGFRRTDCGIAMFSSSVPVLQALRKPVRKSLRRQCS